MAVIFTIVALAGTATASVTTYKWSFDNDTQSWINFTTIDTVNSDNAATGGIVMVWDGSDGNPSGSLNATLTSTTNGKTLTELTMWKSPNFYWNNGTPVSVNLSFDLKLEVYDPNGANSGNGPNYFSALLEKPDGSIVLINSTTLDSSKNAPPNPFPTWTRFNFTIGIDNFTGNGNYNLILNASLSAKSTGVTSPMMSIGWDNPNLTFFTLSPNITSWGNNKSNDQSTTLTLNSSEAVRFNATANQTITAWNWFKDGVGQSNNFDNISTSFGAGGTHTLTVNATNGNGITNTVTWNITVPEVIDVTLSGPVDFSSVNAGSSNQPALVPLNVTVQSTTNVNVNLTINGSDFIYGAYSIGVGNLAYSNSSTGTKTSITNSFSLPPYADWINITKLVTTNRSIYLWINIPNAQPAGAYNSTINVQAQKYS